MTRLILTKLNLHSFTVLEGVLNAKKYQIKQLTQIKRKNFIKHTVGQGSAAIWSDPDLGLNWDPEK